MVAEDAAGKASVSKAKVRTVEEKLGREKGYFSHKSWYGYGRKRGPRVCSACYLYAFYHING